MKDNDCFSLAIGILFFFLFLPMTLCFYIATGEFKRRKEAGNPIGFDLVFCLTMLWGLVAFFVILVIITICGG